MLAVVVIAVMTSVSLFGQQVSDTNRSVTAGIAAVVDGGNDAGGTGGADKGNKGGNKGGKGGHKGGKGGGHGRG